MKLFKSRRQNHPLKRANYKVLNDIPGSCKTLVYGNSQGTFRPVSVNANGAVLFRISDSSGKSFSLPLTAFGEIRTANLTPMVGWNFNYNINTDLLTTTGTVSVTDGKAQISATAGSSSTLETISALRYSPGQGALARFTALFDIPTNTGSKELIGIGSSSDGFFFGYNAKSPIEFGILRRKGGADAEWIPQSAWNSDKFNGTGPSGITLIPTKGNVYSIRYQWLGYGAITFHIENPTTGEATIVHRITYANANTTPSIYNPTLPLRAEVSSVGENLVLQTSSGMAFVEGVNNQAIITRNSVSASKSVSTKTNILTIQNNPHYAGGTNNNRVRILVDYMSTTSNGNNNVAIDLIKNASVTGTNYQSIGSNSVVQYDTTGTTVLNGRTFITYQMNNKESNQFLLSNLDIELAPGETLTVTGSSQTSNNIQVSLSWKELW